MHLTDGVIVVFKGFDISKKQPFYLAVDNRGEVYRDYNITIDQQHKFVLRKYSPQRSGGNNNTKEILIGDNIAILSLMNGKYASVSTPPAACGFEAFEFSFRRSEEMVLELYSYYGEGSPSSFNLMNATPNSNKDGNKIDQKILLKATSSNCFLRPDFRKSALESISTANINDYFEVIILNEEPVDHFDGFSANQQTIFYPSPQENETEKNWKDELEKVLKKQKPIYWVIILIVTLLLLIALIYCTQKRQTTDCRIGSDGNFECKTILK